MFSKSTLIIFLWVFKTWFSCRGSVWFLFLLLSWFLFFCVCVGGFVCVCVCVCVKSAYSEKVISPSLIIGGTSLTAKAQ